MQDCHQTTQDWAGEEIEEEVVSHEPRGEKYGRTRPHQTEEISPDYPTAPIIRSSQIICQHDGDMTDDKYPIKDRDYLTFLIGHYERFDQSLDVNWEGIDGGGKLKVKNPIYVRRDSSLF